MLNKLKQRISINRQRESTEKGVDHKYLIETLIQASQELQLMSYDLSNKNRSKICETIEIITEYAVWGDQNNSSFWDYICEQNILALFVSVMKRSKFKEIIIEIIQSISILVSNINQNLNYILSNPSINEFIVYYYNFTDEDIVDYYVSLLKSITIRINKDNLSLFFNERLSYFPVLWQAQKFYNHKEVMVRTAVRAVILGIMKVENKKLTQYLTSFPFVSFYAHFMCYLRTTWLDLNAQINRTNDKNLPTLKESVDDQIDLCYFLSDLYQFCPRASDLLDSALISYCIIPTLLNGFLYDKKNAVQISLGVFLLCQCLQFFDNSKLSTFIIQILFQSRMPSSIISRLETRLQVPASFNQTWTFKTFWDTNFHFVMQHTELIFHKDNHIENEQKSQVDYEYIWMLNYLGIGDQPGILQNLIESEEKYVSNPLMTITTQFLTTKDDRLLYLTIKLIEAAVKREEVSYDIRLKCKIVPTEDNILTGRKDIVSQLLRVQESFNYQIVQVDPPMRLCTIIAASQLLIQFCSNQDKLLQLDDDNISALMDSLWYSVNKLNNQMKNSFYQENILTVFTSQTKKYLQIFILYMSNDLQSIKTILDYQSLLFDVYQLEKEVDLIYRFPTKIQEQASRDLAIFLMMKKLKSLYDGTHQQEVGDSPNPTNSWRVGKNYEPDQRNLLPCVIQGQTIKDKSEKNDLGPCYLVEDEDNFILVTPDIVQTKWAHVQYIYNLKNVEAVIDRAEPRILIVSVTDKNFIDLQIYFDDHTLTQMAKKSIDSKRQLSKQLNLDKIQKILNDTKVECIKFFQSKQERELKRQIQQLNKEADEQISPQQ